MSLLAYPCALTGAVAAVYTRRRCSALPPLQWRLGCFHALESGVKPHTLLFDLDGTLTDPKLGITRCMRYAFERLSALCPPGEVLPSAMGPPLRGTFATLLRTSDAAQIEQALDLYRQRFSTLGLY